MRVAVIGGGFCGAFFAAQLAQKTSVPVLISVIEPRPTLGGGVAYSSTDPAHRVNVPAVRMTLFADRPTDFDQWLRRSGELDTDPEALWLDGHAYPRRAVFGRYVAGIVAARSHARPGVSIEHRRDEAVAVRRHEGGYQVELAQGGMIEADFVVLATSHPPPSLPARVADQLGGDPALIANPWVADALAGVAPDADVLVIGAGLTMADVVASLDRRGHTGRITAFSRRGLLPRGHAKTAVPAPPGWFETNPVPANLRALVRQVRTLVAEAAAAGTPWQVVFDDIRANGQRIWRHLADADRRRFLRHLRVYWDAHRYRIAPQLEAVLRRRASADRFQVLAASLQTARRNEDGRIDINLRPRHRRDGAQMRLTVDHVIVTTGPSHGTVVDQSPVLQSLARQGLLRPDALGLGLAVDASGQVIRADGMSEPTMLVVGPLARGQYGELMGMPQVSAQPNAVAEYVAGMLAERSDGERLPLADESQPLTRLAGARV